MDRVSNLFNKKKSSILNVYCTAGYPKIDSTMEVLNALQESGADIVEIGIPYSDPIADGPVIQQSNMIALQNGISISLLFKQIENCRDNFHLPLILMGYLNPVLQYGFKKFCQDAKRVGADAIILPDLPIFEYQHEYGKIMKENDLHFIFLITPETSEERVRQIDDLSDAFIYAVSSSSTTGNKDVNSGNMNNYLKRIKNMNLKNPVLVGFGIKDKESFSQASTYSNGAIIGSAYIKILEKSENILQSTKEYIGSIIS